MHDHKEWINKKNELKVIWKPEFWESDFESEGEERGMRHGF